MRDSKVSFTELKRMKWGGRGCRYKKTEEISAGATEAEDFTFDSGGGEKLQDFFA